MDSNTNSSGTSVSSGTSGISEFVRRWANSSLREQQGAQSHFNELCAILGMQAPTQADPTGENFAFEKQVIKANGKAGRADVWLRGHFAWEYKGKHRDLDAAYAQLQSYYGDLGNPPLLVVCDFLEYRIYPQFPNMDGRPFVFQNADLVKPETLKYLRWLFEEPETFKKVRDEELQRRAELTKDLALKLADLAQKMRNHPADSPVKRWTSRQVAEFLTRIVFVLFAEDVGLLPRHDGTPIFSYLVGRAAREPERFAPRLRQLFGAMNGDLDEFLAERIPYFNGGLFRDAEVLDITELQLESAQIILEDLCAADWRKVNPTIVGTLFERALDESKRSQLGAHYTSEADIRLIIEPVLMAPLEREWEAIRAEAAPLLQRYTAPDASPREKAEAKEQLTPLYERMMARLGAIRVLDPACGSGNFLYVSLRALKDLEARVRLAFEALNLPFRDVVTPRQLYGIEKDEFAAQLARVVVWIGYLQWRYDATLHLTVASGEPRTAEEISTPILKDGLKGEPEHIVNDDAILRYDAAGKPYEPEWPAVDVIVGNPPFLGDKFMRSGRPDLGQGGLGDKYVDDLRKVFQQRIPGQSDLVCYWFEKARTIIETKPQIRAGLLSTNSIRNGANRVVIERIKTSGEIFMAWSDRPWILNGASVRVSMIGFDSGKERERLLNGKSVSEINTDLTSGVDVTKAQQLSENIDICFLGVTKGGPFDIDENTARKFVESSAKNVEVIKRRIGGKDATAQGKSSTWIIDFGVLTEAQASSYAMPFEYVREHVKPLRDKNRDEFLRTNWWLHQRTRLAMRKAIKGLGRLLVTPEVSKHRVFIWIDSEIVPDHKLHVFAREDDYFFGVLHSYIHESWSLAQCSWMGVGNDPSYSSTRTFETFPFPWAPGKEPTDDPRVARISAAAAELHRVRDAWLNPPEGTVGPGALKLRTLTNLYNAVVDYREKRAAGKPYLTAANQPATLLAEQIAGLHDTLDAAVLAAYGWEDLIGKLRTPEGDEELLRRLLALNLARGGA